MLGAECEVQHTLEFNMQQLIHRLVNAGHNVDLAEIVHHLPLAMLGNGGDRAPAEIVRGSVVGVRQSQSTLVSLASK